MAKGRWPTLWLYGALMREAGLSPSDVETVNNGPAVIKGFNDQGLAIANANWHAPEPVTESITSAKMPAVWGLTQREHAIVFTALWHLLESPDHAAYVDKTPISLVELHDLIHKMK